MKITVKNIEKNYPQIRHKLSDKLRTMYNNDILPALKFYGKNADVTRIIDKFIATVNKEIEYSPEKNKIADEKARQKAAKEAEKEAEKKAKAEQKAAEKLAKNKEKARIKAEKEAQKKEAEVAKNNIMAGNVPHLKSEIAFFKKYIKLHDKECTYRDIQKFYNSVCKAIVAKDLGSKTLKDLVIKMQGKIWKFLEEQDPNTKLTFKISMKDIDTYREIANSENVLLAVLLINRYLTLQTARPTAKRTEEDILKSGNKLLADIRKAKSKNQISKKYNKVMSQIEYFLDTENYLPVEIPYGLNGLGLLGTITDELLSSSVSKIGSRSPLRSTPLKKKTYNNIMPADELCSLNFPIAFIPYEMSKMIGNASPNGSIMIYGAPGGGKTSFVIQFAKLCAIADEDVLIISKEEGVNPTMKEKLIRFGANYPNIHIANDIPDNISSYHKVIFDSVQALQLEPSDLEKYIPFDTLKIYVFQSTKSGSYRGAREYEHIVDCVLKAEDGVVTSEGCKNRFGGRGSYKVY